MSLEDLKNCENIQNVQKLEKTENIKVLIKHWCTHDSMFKTIEFDSDKKSEIRDHLKSVLLVDSTPSIYKAVKVDWKVDIDGI